MKDKVEVDNLLDVKVKRFGMIGQSVWFKYTKTILLETHNNPGNYCPFYAWTKWYNGKKIRTLYEMRNAMII